MHAFLIDKKEEMASNVVHLSSDDAYFITGQTLAVDRGITMVKYFKEVSITRGYIT